MRISVNAVSRSWTFLADSGGLYAPEYTDIKVLLDVAIIHFIHLKVSSLRCQIIPGG